MEETRRRLRTGIRLNRFARLAGLGACLWLAACEGAPESTAEAPTEHVVAQVEEDAHCRVAEAALDAQEGEGEQAAWLQAFFHECIGETSGENAAYRNWQVDARGIRLTGPRVGTQAFGSHQRVQVYYSPSMAEWLEHRDGAPPVGARMVKEMFADFDAQGTDRDGVAFMQRIGGESGDGWLWALFFKPNSPSTQRPLGFVAAQRGVSFCQTCHAVVADGNGTFAHLGNLDGTDVVSYTDLAEVLPVNSSTPLDPLGLGPHGLFAFGGIEAEGDLAGAGLPCPPTSGSGSMPCDREVDLTFFADQQGPVASMVYNDFVVPGTANETDWMTSDACQHCHDVALLQAGRTPEMMRIEPVAAGDGPAAHRFFNLSPYGEAASSLMGRSVRDPLFLAQMEFEQERLPAAPDKVSDFCLSCHGPMGQRAYHAMHPGEDEYLPASVLYEHPGEKEGAIASLSRNGVSCNVCHRIEPTQELEEAYNANFEVADIDRVYGPYADAKGHAMKQAIGVTEFEQGEHLTSGQVCVSCHTVKPPIVEPGEAEADWTKLPRANEQMTWWEWNASDFKNAQDEENRKNCVDCHMTGEFGGAVFGNRSEPIDDFRIANIQGPAFPYAHAHPDPDLVALPVREEYARHSLSGINLIAMELFRLFPADLGAQTLEVGLPAKTFDRNELASRQALSMAREKTAKLVIEEAAFTGDRLKARVRVVNEVGHKFPSGVHFRRAWVELAAFAEGGTDPIWCSGCADDDGWIQFVDASGAGRLPSESAESVEEMQHHWDVIEDARQVRIYEEAYVGSESPQAPLVTSFLGLRHRAKDTKLLPRGFDPSQTFGDALRPIDCRQWPGDCVEPALVGGDLIEYDVSLDEAIAGRIARIEARIHVQAAPPTYLREIGVGVEAGSDSSGPRRQELARLIARLKKKSERFFSKWTVTVACQVRAGAGGSADCLPPPPPITQASAG